MLAELEWDKVFRLSAEASDTPESRVTVPRVAAGGLFAWAFKKKTERAYLVFSGEFGDVLFEVPGVPAIELRARIAPVARWLEASTTVSTPPPAVPPSRA